VTDTPSKAPTASTPSSTPAQTSKPNASQKPHPSAGKDPKQKLMKLSLWDTAGQETYKSITRSYFRGASGALLVYDITRPATFQSATSWLADLRQIAEENIVVVLVGNKSDLADAGAGGARKVSREEAEEWCRKNGILGFCETSAKSGEGVERAFREVAERVWWNVEAGLYDLGDRRSGVKGYGSNKGGTGDGGGGGGREVVLGLGDVSGKGGGCC
jgi:Ras-related protein Rab-2A